MDAEDDRMFKIEPFKDQGMLIFTSKMNCFYEASDAYCNELKANRKKFEAVPGYHGCICSRFLECLIIRMKSAEKQFRKYYTPFIKERHLIKTDIEN